MLLRTNSASTKEAKRASPKQTIVRNRISQFDSKKVLENPREE
jgi:hypothetical protein